MKLLLLLELEAVAGMWAWSVTVKRKKRLAAKTLPLLLLGLVALSGCDAMQHTHSWVNQNGDFLKQTKWQGDDGTYCGTINWWKKSGYWQAYAFRDDSTEHDYQTEAEARAFIGKWCKP